MSGRAMRIEKNVAVPVADGALLRANLYRPDAPGRFPVIMAHGVYGKDVHFADAFSAQWAKLNEIYPDIAREGSSGRYLRWETVDPERWVPDGYVVIQVDARGSGMSPGYLDPFSPTEIRDYYDAIEWAARQPWSNGKVGLAGVSYYAMTQWLVAALQPPSLAAIMPWEGAADHYRDANFHGGILSSTFFSAWWPRQILPNQHGNAATSHRDRETGERTTGPALSEAMLAGNRSRYAEEVPAHPLDDAWHRARTPDLSRIMVPLLSAANWGGPGLHLRGNIEGFLGAASRQKWLSLHVGTHYESFYLPQYVAMQKRFFAHFLKGEHNGWEREAPVQVTVRRVVGTMHRAEHVYPLARTRWTRLHLDAGARTLQAQAGDSARATYATLGEGVHFTSAPYEVETEYTGPLLLRVHVASSSTDLDLFATLRLLDPTGKEVFFVGAHEPVPVARGWLRASHRKTDPARTTPYRPYRRHDVVEQLTPGEIYALDVEIWPTSIVVPCGYRLILTVAGRDFEVPGHPGRLLHNDPRDRGAEFDAEATLLTGGAHDSYLLMPFIPAS